VNRPYDAPHCPWCKRGDGQPRAWHDDRGTASPCPDTTRKRAWFVHTILRGAGGQSRGDPVGRPAGPWRAGNRDDPAARRQDPPSPGAARRPLPAGRGVSLLLRGEQAAAFCPLTQPTCTLPASDVGATRWVARRGRAARAPGMMRCCRARSHQGDAPRRPYMHRGIHPHPALRAGLSLAGRGVFSLPCNCDVQTVTPSHQATSTPLPRPG